MMKLITRIAFGASLSISALYQANSQATYSDDFFVFENFLVEGAPMRACVESVCGSPEASFTREDFLMLHGKKDLRLSHDQEKRLKELGEKIIQTYKKHRLGSTDENSLQSFIEKSRIVLSTNLSEEENRKLETMIPKLKSLFYNVFKFSDPKLNSEFKGIIDQIEVRLPLSAEALYSNLSNWSDYYLNKESLSEDEIDEAMNRLSLAEPQWYVERMVFDKTIPRASGLSYVQMSPYSVRYLEDGIPTLLHELTHAIVWELRDFVEKHGEDRLSQETLKHIDHWECLNKQNHIASNSEALKDESQDLPEHPTTEEDFADYLSSFLSEKAVKLFPNVELRNPFCSVYLKSHGYYKILQYKKFAEKSQTGRYAHDFWRMLHFLKQNKLKQIPQQCRSFITAENNFTCSN